MIKNTSLFAEGTVKYLSSMGVETEPVRLDESTGKKFTFFRGPDDLSIERYEERE